jgi:hypothetical protein
MIISLSVHKYMNKQSDGAKTYGYKHQTRNRRCGSYLFACPATGSNTSSNPCLVHPVALAINKKNETPLFATVFVVLSTLHYYMFRIT